MANNETNEDPFIAQLQDKLLAQSDLISSSTTKIEDKIQQAISGVQTAQTASAKRIESEFDREISFQEEQFGQERDAQLESRRGFATNVTALRALDERTEKSLRDLEQRKQELILQGEAAAAGQIAQLQLQSLQFQLQSEQQVFQNLLAGGQLGLQRQAIEEERRSRLFQEEQVAANLATEFGVDVRPGESLSDLVKRVSPLASEDRKRRIAQELANIERAKAEAAKAASGVDSAFDQPTIDTLADTLNSLMMSNDPFAGQTIEAILGNIVEKQGARGLAAVSRAREKNRSERFSEENIRAEIEDDIKNDRSRSDIQNAIDTNPLMTVEEKETAEKILDELKPRRGFLGFGGPKSGPLPEVLPNPKIF